MALSSDVYFPPVGFYFRVNVKEGASPEIDASFQEISGMELEFDVEALNEGGQNQYTYQLPKRAKHPNLVMKRGMVSVASDLAQWAADTLDGYFDKPIEPRTLEVQLLTYRGDPLVGWTFYNAYPLKWSTSALNSTESKIVVETLEMAYATVQRTVFNPPPPPPPPPPVKRK